MRRADQRLAGVDIPFRIQLFQRPAQQSGGNLIDSGTPAGLMNDLAFFQQGVGIGVLSMFSHRHFPF
ncbi:hypothetical protein D3C76_1610460 [compost metagenome]